MTEITRIAERDAKPILLDLYSGAGGAARGYQQAGFYVVGVDIARQPNYGGDEVHQANALEVLDRIGYGLSLIEGDLGWHVEDFALIHASPPCEHYANVTRWRGDPDDHPDLITATRALLEMTGLPYVIENVREAPIRADFMLCGTTFGLPIRRHRHFETSWSGQTMSHPCQHRDSDYSFDHGGKQTESVYRDAMGCEWMTVRESRDAIPPAYTKHIGQQFLAHREEVAA